MSEKTTDPLVRIGGVDIHEDDIRPLNLKEKSYVIITIGFGLIVWAVAMWAVAMWLLMR